MRNSPVAAGDIAVLSFGSTDASVRARSRRSTQLVSRRLATRSAPANSIGTYRPNGRIISLTLVAPAIAPAAPPIWMIGNRRSPSSFVYRSLAKPQNCARIMTLKIPIQM